MTVDPQKVYLIVSNSGQPTPVQFLKNGTPTLISIKDPMAAHLHQGPMIGEGVQFYNENGEIECGVQVDTYHFFVDSNNKVRPIPPGSILQGNFKPASTSPDNFSQVNDNNSKQKLEHCEKNASPYSASEPIDSFESSLVPENAVEDEVLNNGESSTIFSKSLNLLGDSQVDLYTSQEDIELEEEIVSVSDLPMKGKVTQELTGSKKSTGDDGISNSNLVASEFNKMSHGKCKKKKKCRTPTIHELAKRKVMSNKRKSHLPSTNATTSVAQQDSKVFPPADSSVNSKENVDDKQIFTNQMDKLFQVAEAELLAVTSLEKKEKNSLNILGESGAPIPFINLTTVVASTELDVKHDVPSLKSNEIVSDSLILEEPITKLTSSGNECLTASRNEDIKTDNAISTLEKINSPDHNLNLVSTETNTGLSTTDLENKIIPKCHEDNVTDKTSFSESCEFSIHANLMTKAELRANVDEADKSDEINKRLSVGNEMSAKHDANVDEQNDFATEIDDNVQSTTSKCDENDAKNDNDQSVDHNKHEENSAESHKEDLVLEPCSEVVSDVPIDHSKFQASVTVEHEFLNEKSFRNETTPAIFNSSVKDNELRPCNITKSPKDLAGNTDGTLKTYLLSTCKEKVPENDKIDENEVTSEKSNEELLDGININGSRESQNILCIQSENLIDASNKKLTDTVKLLETNNICPCIEIRYEKEDLSGDKLEVEKLESVANRNNSDEEMQQLNITTTDEPSKNNLNREVGYRSNFQRFVRIRYDWSNPYIDEPINKKRKMTCEYLLTKNMIIEREQEIRRKALAGLHSKLVSERRQMKIDEIRRKRVESDARLMIENLKTELEVIKTAHSKALDEIKVLNSKLENFNYSPKTDVPPISCGNTLGFDDFSSDSQIYNSQQGNKSRRKSQRINAKDEIKDCDDKDDIKSVTSVETSESNDSKPSRITRRSVAISKSDSLVENKFSPLNISKSCDTESVIKSSKCTEKN